MIEGRIRSMRMIRLDIKKKIIKQERLIAIVLLVVGLPTCILGALFDKSGFYFNVGYFMTSCSMLMGLFYLQSKSEIRRLGGEE